MDFIVKTLLPIVLFLGFISYCLKVYYHFSYLKIIKNYPKQLSFFMFLGFVNAYIIDRFEIILPFLLKRRKSNLTDAEVKIVVTLEKRIMICIILSIIGFATIPLGIYLQNNV